MFEKILKKIGHLALPIQLVSVLVFAFLLGDYLPTSLVQMFYALSVTIKSGLVFVLPLVVFSCLFSSLIEMSEKKGAIFLVLGILIAICFSNFTSTLIAFSVQKVSVHAQWLTPRLEVGTAIPLEPYWMVRLPTLVANDVALLAGLIAGLLAGYWRNPLVLRVSEKLRGLTHIILNRIFIPLVPLFVLGFALKLQYEKTLTVIVTECGPVFLLVSIVGAAYLGFLYYLGSGFRLNLAVRMMNRILPSAVSGFSTMSSAASLPLTLEAAEVNTQQPKLARVIIPMTVNNHLIGDSLFIPLVGLILLTASGQATPDLISYLPFAFYFVAAKFAVAAVPGGGILVMLPILERYLGLNTEMLSLITTLYILFDPFITGANVAGNGALAILLSKAVTQLGRRRNQLFRL